MAPWIMSQHWEQLLFMHWAVPAEVMQAHLPPQLKPDTFDGRAWIGVVPFAMRGIRGRFLPPVPGTSAFLELNVRTYVTLDDKPGVFFFSLDAANKLAVRVARKWFSLPYMDADMSLTGDGERIHYRSHRTHANEPPADFEALYGPTGPVYQSERGSLDWFLTERYCLYAVNPKGHVLRGDIQHVPWPLQPAACEVATNTMSPVPLPDELPLLHFARHIHTRIWAPKRVR